MVGPPTLCLSVLEAVLSECKAYFESAGDFALVVPVAQLIVVIPDLLQGGETQLASSLYVFYHNWSKT